jgi:hypothetical protein
MKLSRLGKLHCIIIHSLYLYTFFVTNRFNENELIKYTHLYVTVYDHDKKKEMLGEVVFDMRKLKKNTNDNRWHKLHTQGDIQLEMHAKNFGVSPVGVLFSDICPVVQIRTIDEEAIIYIRESARNTLDELALRQSQLGRAIDIKNTRIRILQNVLTGLQTYPVYSEVMNNVDASHVPLDNQEHVMNLQTQMDYMIVTNRTEEDQLVLSQTIQRTNVLNNLQKVLSEIEQQRKVLDAKVRQLEELMRQSDQIALS